MRIYSTFSVSALIVALQFVIGSSEADADQQKQSPPIVVMAGSEDAEGVTQADFDLNALKLLENRTLEQLRVKMQDYLRAQGQSLAVPKLQAESNYVEVGKQKLAVVRIKSPQTVNQLFVFGIKGKELRRVVCVRTTKLEESVPLSYGPCGEKIREVFGVAVGS
jgi:hypothetical protein